MQQLRSIFILTGFLILGMSVLTGQALAHPHSHGKNPFENDKKATSLHCLLKQHTNHLLTHCPHAQNQKGTAPILTSACGKNPVSTPAPNVQKLVSPVAIPLSFVIQNNDQVTLFSIENKIPTTLRFETVTPPPQA